MMRFYVPLKMSSPTPGVRVPQVEYHWPRPRRLKTTTTKTEDTVSNT
jgi:hypothetical protein